MRADASAEVADGHASLDCEKPRELEASRCRSVARGLRISATGHAGGAKAAAVASSRDVGNADRTGGC